METEGDRDFLLRTGGHCCLCLAKVPSQMPSVKVEPGTDLFQPKKKKSVSNGKHSLQYLSRYLELNLGAVNGPDPKAKLEEPRLKGILCEGCGALKGRFPELHRERDRIQTGVKACLSAIGERLNQLGREVEEEEESTMEETSEQSLDEQDVRIWEAARTQFLQKCLLKLKRPPPPVKIIELSWDEDSEVEEERPDVKIENERYPLLDDSEDDANSRHSCNSSGDDEPSKVKLEEDADEATDEEADSTTDRKRSTRSLLKGSVKRSVEQNPATGKFKCPSPTCETEFSSQRSAERHYRSVHLKLRNFACLLCGVAFNEQWALTKHTNAVHLNIRPHRCDKCGKKFFRKFQLQVHHEAVHTSVKRYPCDLCERRFASEQLLRRHRRDVHLKSKPSRRRETVTKSDRKVSDRGSIRSSRGSSVSVSSVAKNPTTGKFTCPSPTCETEFTTQRSAKRHYRSVHLKPNGNFCDICGKSFMDLGKHHRSVHLNLRPYECEECGKQFTRNFSLEQHKAIAHTNDKRYQCDLCEKRFPTELYLRRHRKKIHLKLDQAPLGESSTKSGRKGKKIRSSLGTKSSVKISVTKNPTTGKFKCPEPECETEFTIQYSAERHYRVVHLGLKPTCVPCEKCGKTFSKASTLKTHFDAVHLQIKQQCEECGELFSSKENLRRHRKRLHDPSSLRNHVKRIQQKNRRWKCNLCGEQFGLKSMVNQHNRTVHPVKPGTRSKPERRTERYRVPSPSPSDLESEHQDTQNQENAGEGPSETNDTTGPGPGSTSESNAVTGPTLKAAATSKAEKSLDETTMKILLEQSAEMSFDRNPNTGNSVCPDCDYQNAKVNEVRKHYRCVHLKIKRFACDLCGRGFQSRGALNSHYRAIHLKLKPFRCDECGKEFSQRGAFESHWDGVHLKLKQHECNQCEMAFCHLSHLIEHRKRVHLKITPQHGCDECGKGFSRNRLLLRHKQAAHPKVKRYKCDECGTLFGTNFQVVQHKRVAHPPKAMKWVCYTCGKMFTDNSKLNTHHQVVHLNIRHICDQCGKMFTEKSRLDSHYKTVHLNFRHVCDQCGKEYKNVESLRYHCRIAHPDPDSSKEMQKSPAPGPPESGVNADSEPPSSPLQGEEGAEVDKREEMKRDTNSTEESSSQNYYSYDKNTRQFKCRFCDEVTLSPKDAHAHHRLKHLEVIRVNIPAAAAGAEPGEFHCDQCEKKFTSREGLTRHYRTIHLGVRWKCPVCEKIFGLKEGLKKHLTLYQKTCQQRVSSANITGTGSYKCPLCEKDFGETEALWAHCKAEHSIKRKRPPKIVCKACGKEFTDQRKWNRHREGPCSGGTKIKIPCPECGKIVGKYSLYHHYRNMHKGVPYTIRMLDNLC